MHSGLNSSFGRVCAEVAVVQEAELAPDFGGCEGGDVSRTEPFTAIIPVPRVKRSRRAPVVDPCVIECAIEFAAGWKFPDFVSQLRIA